MTKKTTFILYQVSNLYKKLYKSLWLNGGAVLVCCLKKIHIGNQFYNYHILETLKHVYSKL